MATSQEQTRKLQELLLENFGKMDIPNSSEDLEKQFGELYMNLLEEKISNAIILQKNYKEIIKPLYLEYVNQYFLISIMIY